MATELKRPLRRVVYTASGKRLILTLTNRGIEMREPYQRQPLMLPYGSAWVRAGDIAAQERRREKAAKKKVRNSLCGGSDVRGR